MSKDLRIVFMGTPEFAVGVLKELVAAEKNIVGVVTAPDKPAGRGRQISTSAVKDFAMEKNLNILQPTNLKDESFLAELKKLNANLQIVVAFRMLPKIVWQMPELGTFNLHASLLPQYRGAAPINWAIINGEKKTGVTTFFIDEKIDTGDIILNKEVGIEKKETAGTLYKKLMDTGSQLVLETVSQIENGTVKTITQPKRDILKDAPKLTPENTKINWQKAGDEIDSFIRGLAPYPVAWSFLINNNEKVKVKIYAATFLKETHNMNNGQILSSKKELKIAVNDGFVSITEMQLPGKRKMDIASLLNGYSFEANSKLL
ncbi:methionyl-tRNA formyltransferase [Aequorivita echinoideorum]|uniref:Methionyl-tRNA formyltransferase n=1 Tax=Aequorivita echinoideorum TaxID=1549647 RepID=A0ABS5S4M9_9FLAO|nr:methionyl-tRNA formyltransferase [Aequorivita echinoideorum]MBT0608168.1 methionyl-tRNA formyltransferase [Aequorivita echinoideorum]